jgi:hypothetical protein
MLGEIVYTECGRGKVVYVLPDGTCVVQYDFGGGAVLRPSQLLRPERERSDTAHRVLDIHPSESWAIVA